MRKFLITLLLCITMPLCAIAQGGIGVLVDGKSCRDDAFVEEGTTYAPLRAICEALGKSVEWDNDTRSVYIGEKKGEAKIGEHINIFIDGTPLNATNVNGDAVYPIISEDKTYLPVRAISSALGKNVEWDNTAKRVFISTSLSEDMRDKIFSIRNLNSSDNMKIEMVLTSHSDAETLWTKSLSLKLCDIFPALLEGSVYPLGESSFAFHIDSIKVPLISEAISEQIAQGSEIFNLSCGYVYGEFTLDGTGSAANCAFELPFTVTGEKFGGSYSIRIIGTVEKNTEIKEEEASTEASSFA